MPALNDKVSGSTASASAIVSSTIASGRGVAGTGGIGVDEAMVLGVFGVPGDLSILDAFSALTNMSNLALHLLLCLPFSSEHALQSGVAPKRIMRSRVIYSCRTAGDASDGRLEKGTSFGRYSVKFASPNSANAVSAAACNGRMGSPGGTYTSSQGTDKATEYPDFSDLTAA